MYKAVIFDMDGVLFDSERLLLEEWKKTGLRYGLRDVEAVCFRCIGTTAEKTREIFTESYGEDFPYDICRETVFSKFRQKSMAGELPVKKGAEKLLKYLKEKDVRVGLATSSAESIVAAELEATDLRKYFDDVLCGNMVARSKPEPDIFLESCRRLQAEPKETMVIEDSYNGIRAAHRAGTVPVMVPDLLAPDEEMKQLAYRIFRDLSEVREWLVRTAGKEEK